MKDLTNTYELHEWWNKPLDERNKDWKKKYNAKHVGYEDYVQRFTYETRKYTGEWLLKEIEKDGEDVIVLDIGCGKNPFKNRIKNVIGVEPGNWGNPDLNLNCTEAFSLFRENSIDWILSIGVLHHSNTEEIHEMVEQMKAMVKPNGKIACLCKPVDGYPKLDKDGPQIYPWTYETCDALTDAHNLKYYQKPIIDYTDVRLNFLDTEMIYDPIIDNRCRERIFWIWQKN